MSPCDCSICERERDLTSARVAVLEAENAKLKDLATDRIKVEIGECARKAKPEPVDHAELQGVVAELTCRAQVNGMQYVDPPVLRGWRDTIMRAISAPKVPISDAEIRRVLKEMQRYCDNTCAITMLNREHVIRWYNTMRAVGADLVVARESLEQCKIALPDELRGGSVPQGIDALIRARKEAEAQTDKGWRRAMGLEMTHADDHACLAKTTRERDEARTNLATATARNAELLASNQRLIDDICLERDWAAKVTKERDEARADLAKITKENKELGGVQADLIARRDAWKSTAEHQFATMAKECDESRAEVATLRDILEHCEVALPASVKGGTVERGINLLVEHRDRYLNEIDIVRAAGDATTSELRAEVARLKQCVTDLEHGKVAHRDMVKDALRRFLEYLDKDDIVFRRPNGAQVSIGEALEMIDSGDPYIVEFLRDVYAAAVRAVRIKSKRPVP